MPSSPVAQRSRGLTFVEVACVLTILAILAALAVPPMQQFADGQRLRTVAAALAADLRFLRSAGLARNETLRLRVQATSDGGCYVIHTGAASACGCAVGGQARCDGVARALRSVRWSAADRVRLETSATSLRFDPLHGTVTPTATLRVVGTQGAAIHLVVNIVGRVRSCAAGAPVAGHPPC